LVTINSPNDMLLSAESNGVLYLPQLTTGSGFPLFLSADLNGFVSLPALVSLTISSSLREVRGGSVSLPGLLSYTNATVTNDAADTFTLQGNQPFSETTNFGVVIQTGTLVNNGVLSLVNSSTNTLPEGVTINGSGVLITNVGSTVRISGDLLGNTT